MKRSRLGNGARSLARGATFSAEPRPLERARNPRPPRAISQASPEQRAKVAGAVSIVSGDGPCDPAHIWPRGMGGCDSADCVVPLTCEEHRAFDDGRLDILPYLLAHGCWVEIAHAVSAHQVDLIALLQRVIGCRWEPAGSEAAA